VDRRINSDPGIDIYRNIPIYLATYGWAFLFDLLETNLPAKPAFVALGDTVPSPTFRSKSGEEMYPFGVETTFSFVV
jgi:hypothetical protein